MNELANIPWALIAPLLIVEAILLIVALVDIYKSPKTNGPKWAWVIVAIAFGFIGPIVYFLVGRKNG